MTHNHNIAIIGAGLAGISAAQALTQSGHRVTLYDKSRGSGGRMCSKRTTEGDFDIGAQYFTARDSQFRQEVKRWLDQGWVTEWNPRLYRYDDNGLTPSEDDQQRFVGTPRMTAWSRHLLEGLELVGETRIVRLHPEADRQWLLVDEHDRHYGPYDRVVIATPAPQAVPLLEAAPQLAQTAAQVQMEAGWAVAMAFEQPLTTNVDACFVRTGPLDWVARNSSKPGRAGLDTWVVQSTASWAEGHLDLKPEAVTQQLGQALAEVLGLHLPPPVQSHAHRWLYARPNGEYNWGALAAPELGVYVCGDWCLGGRLENAWLSGLQAARTLT
ncbi:NAD(P)/FAD-dependent oxidoreductase [Halopseudomonas phragmitis]|uniref:FAD-dependent oxidoreductase n=1 Tax=Halopseudomonas phragmitis TaxID=1931241 RepID=A0A1V0B0S2_9GAMM|nr:FAD-dependent oxidoreductase [Halopseudomonas phragmitis]AQZ93532.1 FAD-dependent oxidoreductase [Halopseudomonas phragmitis]